MECAFDNFHSSVTHIELTIPGSKMRRQNADGRQASNSMAKRIQKESYFSKWFPFYANNNYDESPKEFRSR